jgi:hypothetical protein
MAIDLTASSTQYLEYGGKLVSSLPCTIIGWVRRTVDTGLGQFWASQCQSNADRYMAAWMGSNFNNFATLFNPGNGSSAVQTTPADSTFRLFMAVFTSTTSRVMYFDSTTEGTVDTGSLTDDITNHNRIVIGAFHHNSNSPSLYLSGSIAEVHFYARALGDSDFTALSTAATLPEDVADWVDGWTLGDNTTLTSLGGTRTLTAYGSPSTSGTAHPLTLTGRGTASQILLPASDVTTTGWTSSLGGALYAAVDEAVASDTDYITTGTLNAECEIKLQAGSTPGSGSRNLKVRAPAGFTPVGNWSVSLYQGGSLVQAFTTPAPAADTTVTFSVTNAITDYSDLRVRIKSTA